MPEGLLISNDNNTVQVDSTYKNMTLNQIRNVSNPILHDINKVIALRTEEGPFSIRCYCKDSINCYYAVNRGVTCYEYTWQSLPSVAGAGLEIYDAQGNVVFNSNIKPLRVLDFVSLDVRSITSFSRNYAGKKIAIVPSQIPYNWERNQQNVRGYSTIFTITGSNLSVTYGIAAEWYAYKGSLSASATRGDLFTPYANFLVVDVSNYE